MEYSLFSFSDTKYNLEKGVITLGYRVGTSYSFEETYTFQPFLKPITTEQKASLDATIQALHLAAGVSYWKIFAPKNISLPLYSLSTSEASFWNTLYCEGLGQFYFENNLPPEIHAPHFIATKQGQINDLSLRKNCKFMLPWGGGKDSIVSSILLDQQGIDYTPIIIGTSGPQTETLKALGKEPIIVRRKLSPNIYELNKDPDSYNGHVPVTAIYAFIKTFIALLHGFTDIVLSNELSANIGNINWEGIEVNHQYSKSFACEEMLHKYITTSISPDINYFSLLRNRYELNIASVFADHGQRFFANFASCNANFRKKNPQTTTNWCCDCPKCAFVFLILSAWMDKKTLVGFFGRDLYETPQLFDTFQELIGEKDFKPLECVGTKEESLVALWMASQHTSWKSSTFIQNTKGILNKYKRDLPGWKADILALQETNHLIDSTIQCIK